MKLIKLFVAVSIFFPNNIIKNEDTSAVNNINIMPRMIAMSIFNDSKTEMAFNYNTTEETDTILQVIEKENGNFDSEDLKEYEGTTTKSLVKNDGYIHRVVATNLKENTKYLYRLGDKELNCWSDVGEFKTANGSDNLKFIHISDAQGYEESDYDAYNILLKEAIKTTNPDFFALTGDIVNRSYAGTTPKLEEWEWAITKQKEIMMNYPFMTCPGNHDESPNDYYSRFNHPIYMEGLTEKGSYYSFDYQGSHFISINTNDTIDSGEDDSEGLSKTQMSWLENDLRNSQDSNFIIVMMHKGIYDPGRHSTNEGGSDYDIAHIRNQVTPLFSKYNVDLVLQGHDHLYSRTYPLKGTYENNVLEVIPSIDTNVENVTYNEIDYRSYYNPEGTIYLNTGSSSGSKYYDLAEYDPNLIPIEVSDTTEVQRYTSFEIVGDKLYAKVYNVEDGISKIFDTFAIDKSDTTDNQDKDDITSEEVSSEEIVSSEFNSEFVSEENYSTEQQTTSIIEPTSEESLSEEDSKESSVLENESSLEESLEPSIENSISEENSSDELISEEESSEIISSDEEFSSSEISEESSSELLSEKDSINQETDSYKTNGLGTLLMVIAVVVGLIFLAAVIVAKIRK